MNTLLFSKPARTITMLASLLLLVIGCKKEADQDPLAACRPPTTGTGVGIPNPRTVMFWTAKDFQCGSLNFVSIRNTTLNTYDYGGSASQSAVTHFYATQPACGASGTLNIQVSKGYVYEYIIACTGRQWKGTLTADCNDDCIAIQLK